MTTEEENLRLIEGRNRALPEDWDGFIDVHAEFVLVFAPGMEEPLKGKEDAARFFHAFSRVFPDARPEVLHSFGGG
ncbi:MAG: hypothetical protein ACE5EW_05005 [Thermoplasmata archaeon]